MTIEPESPNSSFSLNDLLMQGRAAEKIDVDKALNKVSITQQPKRPGVNRVKDHSTFSAHINFRRLFSALTRVGGNIARINQTGDNSKFGVISLDCESAGNEDESGVISEKSEFKIKNLHDLSKHVRIVGAPGLNVLLLTSEGHNIRRPLSVEQIDEARIWIMEKGLKIKSEVVTSMFHLDGPRILTESLAFIIEE